MILLKINDVHYFKINNYSMKPYTYINDSLIYFITLFKFITKIEINEDNFEIIDIKNRLLFGNDNKFEKIYYSWFIGRPDLNEIKKNMIEQMKILIPEFNNNKFNKNDKIFDDDFYNIDYTHENKKIYFYATKEIKSSKEIKYENII